jgi:hypothetical protein
MEDLKAEIAKWQSAGEQIILCGDFNTGDQRNEKSAAQFWQPWLDNLSLIDVHKSHCGLDWLPPTHERGKTQIDYIFASPSIQIKRAGFLPFQKLPGDHRALWVDICTRDIIGYSPPALSIASARRLKSDNPIARKKYLAYLVDQLESEKIPETLKALELVPTTEWNQTHLQVYEGLESRFKELMATAERKCRKFRTGAHPFSEKFNVARKQNFFWELMVKDLLGLTISKRKLPKLKKQLKITKTISSLKFAEEEQAKARRQYRVTKRNSKNYRHTFRDQLAAARAAENKTKIASEIRNITHREEVREMHKRIKWMRGKIRGESTSGVIIQKPKGGSKLIMNKEELEAQIIMENEAKYHQTEGHCPLMEGILLQHLGTTATTPKATEIIDGTYNFPPSINKATKTFLPACKRPHPFTIPAFDHFSKDQYIRAWSKAKENTGSGELHFGHWKSGIRNDYVAHAQWLLTFLPNKHGFSPKTWRKATDV